MSVLYLFWSFAHLLHRSQPYHSNQNPLVGKERHRYYLLVRQMHPEAWAGLLYAFWFAMMGLAEAAIFQAWPRHFQASLQRAYARSLWHKQKWCIASAPCTSCCIVQLGLLQSYDRTDKNLLDGWSWWAQRASLPLLSLSVGLTPACSFWAAAATWKALHDVLQNIFDIAVYLVSILPLWLLYFFPCQWLQQKCLFTFVCWHITAIQPKLSSVESRFQQI